MECFKSVMMRVQDMHVLVRGMDNAGGSREAWMMTAIEALVRKKRKALDRPKQQGSSRTEEQT